jgi:hypothetical protein
LHPRSSGEHILAFVVDPSTREVTDSSIGDRDVRVAGRLPFTRLDLARSDVHGWRSPSGAGGGHVRGHGTDPLLFELTNATSETCRLDGYPAIALTDRRGESIPFRYRNGGDQMVTSGAPEPVTLAPGGSAYFLINKTTCEGGNKRVATAIEVGVPGESMGLHLSLARYPILDHCGPSDPGSVVDISPIVANPRAVLATH